MVDRMVDIEVAWIAFLFSLLYVFRLLVIRFVLVLARSGSHSHRLFSAK